MPAFTAINVDVEESVDEEVDNTRQIQIDDALKLFQAALKLHAQGPRSYEEASEAYDTLFASAIFKYPEASTEYERAERQPDPVLALETSFTEALEAANAEADGSGSSLPQALYLAYKNHGQFALDRIRHRVRRAVPQPPALFEAPETLADAHQALDDFDAALDRDPADAELWRRTARVAAFLKSARIERYCLEAAIELDDDPAVVEVEPPSLAEGFAGEQLKQQLQMLSDDIALSHPVMGPYLKQHMAAALRRYLDPLPWLPDPTKGIALVMPSSEGASPTRLVVSVPSPTWAELGMGLVRLVNEMGLPGQALVVKMPGIPDQVLPTKMEVDEEETQSSGQVPMIMDRVLDSPAQETPEEEAKEKGAPNGEAKESNDTSNADEPPKEKDSQAERSASQLARKRSQSAAGLPDQGDEENGDTKRSKRIRRRETAAAAAEEAVDPNTLFATQLQPYQAADQNLFQMTKNILENFGVSDRVTLDRLSETIDSCASEDRTSKPSNQAAIDLRDSLVSFNEGHAKILLNKRDAPALGLNAFLEHTKSGNQHGPIIRDLDETQDLGAFVSRINGGWFAVHDAAYEWVVCVSKTYVSSKWSAPMKTAVVQVISRLDEAIYRRVLDELELAGESGNPGEGVQDLERLVQTLAELYLDVYDRIINPSSVVDYAVRMETKGRLGRWMDLASAISRSPSRQQVVNDELSLRFLFASVIWTTFADGVSRDHILACWESLREFLEEAGWPVITLPNNVIMPEVSPKAADREISKLTTMDFFLSLFQEDINDPVAVIDTLEPVLNPGSVYVPVRAGSEKRTVSSPGAKSKPNKVPIAECASQQLRDLWKFLVGSSTDLRLFLWSRLGEAYDAIKYTTKQFSCHLRSIEMIIHDLDREVYLGAPNETRKLLFLQMLKSLDEVLIKALHLALNDASAFDFVDEEHVRFTCSALAQLSCTMQQAATFEDEVRIGMTQTPSNTPIFQQFLAKLREIQARTWSLQYTLLKVGISQNKAIFPSPENDFTEYLAAVHQVLGPRKYCKVSNKIFLRMMKVELLKQKNIENWEDHLGQVLYDLHGLKLGVGIWDVQEHGCPAEKLEKKNALALVEKVMVLANRMPMKDLLKSDLKIAIEHMQQVLGQTKSTRQMIYNLLYFTEYLKKPIHPLRLYQAFKGNVHLDAVDAVTPDAILAKNGWYFLMGMIALTRFKAVDLNRRQTPGATDDLRVGAQYLRLQLQLTPDFWEAWFRLAECFDYDLDEAVLWTAEKINKDRGELTKLQRNAIHCYTLALSTSHAVQLEFSENVEEALHEMYHNFGLRIYASSREPFAMDAFTHADQERFFIEPMGAGTYKKIIHGQMSDYQAWKYAAGLFRKAMPGRPKDWKNAYMFAKCIWKMYRKPLDQLSEHEQTRRPTVEDVIQALEKTIEIAALLPKPRHGQDPVLEPHYKVLSVVHKLVTRGDLAVKEGFEIMQRQPYAVQHGGGPVDAEDWEGYVIKSLRFLRDKDKSNWQHRIIIRHARILFDYDDGSDPTAAASADGPGYVQAVQAKAAFSVLRESMFTKTMVMNVWKCDAERPGRHHVYTEQYVRFMTRLLVVLNDRANMEALLRRIRKKGADFYHFNELWHTCLSSYVSILRQTYDVPLNGEDVFKSLSQEEFEIVAERITEWVGELGVEEHATLGAMKEAVELKKLNANLTKATPIDDLIYDCYSIIYATVGRGLPGEDPAKIIEERHRQQKEEAEKAVAEADAAAAAAEEKAPPNGLNGLLGVADKEDTSRAGSEAGEKMEKQASGMGEHHSRRSKPAGVRKADVLRRADQAILRFTEPPPKSAVSISSRGESRKSRLGSASSGKNETAPNNDDAEHTSDNGGDEDVEMKDGENIDVNQTRNGEAGGGAEGEEEDNDSDISSPPGSVHDSADDESDLSDVPADYEDNVPPSLLFPNLRRSAEAVAVTATASTQDSTAASTADDGSSPPADEEDE